ncbi:MAG: hypothetical protein ACR2ND_09365 [Solirubrobacteraceae bacterium]
MSNTSTIYLVAGVCGVLGLIAWVALILVPAVSSYRATGQRFAAGFLSLYVLAAMMGIGLAAGAAVIWIWDHYIG